MRVFSGNQATREMSEKCPSFDVLENAAIPSMGRNLYCVKDLGLVVETVVVFVVFLFVELLVWTEVDEEEEVLGVFVLASAVALLV